MSRPDLTLVTAADQNYFWGLYLLAASVERWQLGDRLVIFHTGLNAESEAWLGQFSRVELRKFTQNKPFGLHCRKAEAMVQVEGEYIGWLDSDCLVIGDLNDVIIPENGGIQARMRTSAETVSDLQRFYQPGEAPGGLPKVILDTWRADVGERETSRIQGMVPSNVFIMHSKYKPFLEHWERQMTKVLNPKRGTLDHDKPAYFLTDESVLNSLLAFAEFAPEVSDYRLASERNRHIAHFMGSPKPWVRWLPRNLYCLPFVVELLEWLVKNGRDVPPLPASFVADRQKRSAVEAHVYSRINRAQSISRKMMAKICG